MIDLLNASCPGDHATQKTTPTSCGNSACAFFISAIDDRKFALVNAGLGECAGDSTNPFTGFSERLPKWNDKLIRQKYAKYCGLPFGIPLWAKHATIMCASVHASVRERARPPKPAHAHSSSSAAISHTHTPLPWVCERARPKLCAQTRIPHSISQMHTQPGTVKLTPPSPETCYGAAVMIDMMLGYTL
jgi:hypothetical protein